MDNFTPLKPIEKKKKKFNKFLIFGNLFLVILVAAIGIFYYNQKLQTTQQKAYEHQQCSGYGSPSQCDSNCSPYKSNGQSFFCKWSFTQNECKESSDICEAGGGGGGGIIGGSGCTKIDNKCYNCTVQAGDANHYTCSYLPINNAGCPNDFQTGEVSKTHLGFQNAGTQQFCFDGGPDVCGSEQIDWQGGFISRVGPEACGGSAGGSTPTPTPTPPGATNTPTPTKTPTPTRTPTPTPTPTGTIVPSNTPTVTPTGTLTPTPTGTLTPTPTNTPGSSATPIPVICGTKDCDNATNPCRSGYNCVQANDGSNYCTSPDFTNACKANPSYNSCCTAPGAPTVTPTEIMLAQTTVTTAPPPVTGRSAWWIYIIPTLIIFGGLIL
ncbi:MAG: hypothetical protein WCX78_02555 [Patescibacteria group bacterium]